MTAKLLESRAFYYNGQPCWRISLWEYSYSEKPLYKVRLICERHKWSMQTLGQRDYAIAMRRYQNLLHLCRENADSEERL